MPVESGVSVASGDIGFDGAGEGLHTRVGSAGDMSTVEAAPAASVQVQTGLCLFSVSEGQTVAIGRTVRVFWVQKSHGCVRWKL